MDSGLETVEESNQWEVPEQANNYLYIIGEYNIFPPNLHGTVANLPFPDPIYGHPFLLTLDPDWFLQLPECDRLFAAEALQVI